MAPTVALTSDTCNVMKDVRNGVIAKLREEQPKVLDIQLHNLVNLCVKSAVKALPMKLMKYWLIYAAIFITMV